MQETVKTKKVGEIFRDYQTKSNIQYANIQGLNVVKKNIKPLGITKYMIML